MQDSNLIPIIVVEDDAATRRLVQQQLENAGFSVSVYGDGRAALQPICAMRRGIVIADWSMPEMDGLELCKALRELQEMGALGNVYFILLTAHRTKEKVVEGLEAGANDYLTKPYHPGELLARIHVGARMLRLQDELLNRTIEVHKANAQMALLANKLEQLANTDVLTQLPNRRCVFDRFEAAWKTAEREGQTLSCVMLDIDRFKRINDSFGHAGGDQVLESVGGMVRNASRRPQLCGRVGGEEFLLVLPGAPLAQAAEIAERLRVAIAGRAIKCEDRLVDVTVSCGVAEKTADVTCPDQLLRRADSALYAAKENGRNRTWAMGPDGRPCDVESLGIVVATPVTAPTG